MCLDEKLLTGRPYGGVDILRQKYSSRSSKIVKYDDSRINNGLKLKCNNAILFFYVCIYLTNIICFMVIINKIKTIIKSAITHYVFVLGDFNADIQSDTVFGSELIEFCHYNLLYTWMVVN